MCGRERVLFVEKQVGSEIGASARKAGRGLRRLPAQRRAGAARLEQLGPRQRLCASGSNPGPRRGGGLTHALAGTAKTARMEGKKTNGPACSDVPGLQAGRRGNV